MKSALLVIALVVAFLAITGVLLSRAIDTWISQQAAASEPAKAEAAVFAKTHDQSACVDETLRKQTVCAKGFEGLNCQIVVGAFLSACLLAAQKTPGFCDGVPSADSLTNGALYTANKCKALGTKDDTACNTVAAAIMDYCSKRPGT